MVKVVSDNNDIDDDFSSPLIDDGAPYNGIGLSELSNSNNNTSKMGWLAINTP